MRAFKWIAFLVFIHLTMIACSQKDGIQFVAYDQIQTGAQNTLAYLPLLDGKRVGIVANHASLIGTTHLVDSLCNSDINVVKIFSPEHGFRGKADAGEKIRNGKDSKTGIAIISLYGDHKKPTARDLIGIDVVVFDLQDVGVRFFTYISTLTYVMEACAENDIPVIVLDRPNPNGFYVDGPVLEQQYRSFVGLHPVPIVYGMTIGEYAQMVNGEAWIETPKTCNLTIIPLDGYHHNMIVNLPVKPSPNLPNWQSIYLYPSLCLFEGTVMSVGRGTDFPFQVYGHPDFKIGDFTFTPKDNEGAKHPKFENKECNGFNLTAFAENFPNNPSQIQLSYVREAYRQNQRQHMQPKLYNEFFIDYFTTLAGTDKLRKLIELGIDEEDIRSYWKDDLERFKKIREIYLLYD